MKKKILLSALTLFSVMIAGKSFAQSYDRYHTTYAKNDHYNNGHDYGYKQQEFRNDMRDIHHDQAKINYDLWRIDKKQAELKRDAAFHNWYAYRQDKAELRRLYRDLESDRKDVAFDTRDIRTDVRIAVRF
ncbi:MAG TPA: hypothetical protein VG738_24995 [Chitinophagaceae bacterium]|nr:hypothetical protein [Chitinophagaceae bacterium]